jgi:creatinine amidohydrolase
MQLGTKSWTDMKELTSRVVVCPIGSLEQHGHHLPLLTDSLIGGEIARRVEAATEDCALFTPMLWLGASHHHLSFPGTLSLSQATYRAVIEDMAECLIAAGFRKLFFLNSHAGNSVPTQSALLEVQLRHREIMPELYLSVGSWFELALPELAALGLVQKKVIHACEWETSIIQVTHPELVKESRPAARTELDSAFWSPDHIKSSRLSVIRTMEQGSLSGAFGFPEEATPEKGELLIQTATEVIVRFVKEYACWPTVQGS